MSVTINFSQKHVRTLAVKCKHVKKHEGKNTETEERDGKIAFLRHRSRISKIRKRIQSKKLQKAGEVSYLRG